MRLSGLFARAGVHRAEHVSVARDFSVYSAVNIGSLLLLFRARQRFVALSTRQALANLLKSALIVGLGYAFGLYGVFAALLAAATIQLVLFHTAADEHFERRFDASILRPLLVDGVPML